MTPVQAPGPYRVTVTNVTVERIPFATLEEARQGAALIVGERRSGADPHDPVVDHEAPWPAWDDAVDEVAALGEEGGRVTLPDGTVIEVEQATWHKLARLSGDPELLRQALLAGDAVDGGLAERILAAFNAAQETAA